MSTGGYLQQTNHSPKSLALIILAHAAVLGAVALSKTYVEQRPWEPPIKLKWIPVEKPPPPEFKKADPQKPRHVSRVTTVDPVVDTSRTIETFTEVSTPFPPIGQTGPIDIPEVTPIPIDPPLPVRIGARLDSRSELQPPYPASEQREANEGAVVVRLLVGPDGRVKAVERVSATSDAFWRTTERHAMRAWRFTPATLDGRPVESRFTFTVRFKLEG